MQHMMINVRCCTEDERFILIFLDINSASMGWQVCRYYYFIIIIMKLYNTLTYYGGM